MKKIISVALLCFAVTSCWSVAAMPSTDNSSLNNSEKTLKGDEKKAKGDEAKFKKDLKKVESLLSFKNFKHHHDSVKLVKKYVHQQHQLARKKNYPYSVDHTKLNIPVEKYKKDSLFKLDYEVFGWYPNWDPDLYKTLNYSLLSTVAYFSYEINPSSGAPKTVYDWDTTPAIDSAKVHNTKVLLTITNFGANNNHVFLKNNTSINTLIKEVKELLRKRKANGVCLDFEGVEKNDKNNYAKFISLLSQELKKINKDYLVYMTVPSVDWAKSLDFEIIIPVVDRFIIMGYGYYGATSTVAGPVAPLESGKTWEPYNLLLSVEYYLANKIPSSKLILALPYYGTIWQTKGGNTASKVEKYIGNRTFDYIKSKLIDLNIAPVQYDTLSESPWCSYVTNSDEMTYRQCWFENNKSINSKLNLIKYKKLRGMGIWALGYDKGYDDYWDAISKNLTNTESTPVLNDNSEDNASTTNDTPIANSDILTKLSSIEKILEGVTDYKAILLFIMTLVIVTASIAFIIAMFQPNTRMFFFNNTAYMVYYISVLLLFLIVLLRWIKIINDLSVMLIIGFIAGAVASYFANKWVKRLNNNVP